MDNIIKEEVLLPDEIIAHILSLTELDCFIPAGLVSETWLRVTLSRANAFAPSMPSNNRLVTHKEFFKYWSTERVEILFSRNEGQPTENRIPSLAKEISDLNPLIENFRVQHISDDGQYLLITGVLNYDNKKTLSFLRTPQGLQSLDHIANGTHTKANSMTDFSTTIVGKAWDDGDNQLGRAALWKNDKAHPLEIPAGTTTSEALYVNKSGDSIIGSIKNEANPFDITFVKWHGQIITPLIQFTPIRSVWHSDKESTWQEEADIVGISDDGNRVAANYLLEDVVTHCFSEDVEYNTIIRHAILSIDDPAGPKSIILDPLNGAMDRWATGISQNGQWVCGVAEDGKTEAMLNVRWYENGSIHPLKPIINQSFGYGCKINYNGTVIIGDLVSKETPRPTPTIWIEKSGYHSIDLLMQQLAPELYGQNINILSFSQNGRQLIGMTEDSNIIFKLILPPQLFGE
ncbi:MAG: hypothetical protein ACTHJ4_03440 [Candidatus Nucleicultricaceae bacterium]